MNAMIASLPIYVDSYMPTHQTDDNGIVHEVLYALLPNRVHVHPTRLVRFYMARWAFRVGEYIEHGIHLPIAKA